MQSGSTFSESLAQHPKIFNKLYVNMVKAGELGGVLEVVLNRLAEYQEKAQKLKNKIVSAMVYPVIVMFIAVAIMVFLMTVIVPKFEKIFEDMLGAAAIPSCPAPDQVRHRLQPLVMPNVHLRLHRRRHRRHRPLASLSGRTKGGRACIDTIKLKMPLFGDVQRKSAISRFTRTLGTLVTSGVPILQALNITRDTAGNVVISDAIDKVHDAVKEGETIVTPLEASRRLPAHGHLAWWTSARKPASSRKCCSRSPTSMTTKWTTPSPRSPRCSSRS